MEFGVDLCTAVQEEGDWRIGGLGRIDRQDYWGLGRTVRTGGLLEDSSMIV